MDVPMNFDSWYGVLHFKLVFISVFVTVVLVFHVPSFHCYSFEDGYGLLVYVAFAFGSCYCRYSLSFRTLDLYSKSIGQTIRLSRISPAGFDSQTRRHMDWVRGFSSLLWEVFTWVLQFSSLLKNSYLIWFDLILVNFNLIAKLRATLYRCCQ